MSYKPKCGLLLILACEHALRLLIFLLFVLVIMLLWSGVIWRNTSPFYSATMTTTTTTTATAAVFNTTTFTTTLQLSVMYLSIYLLSAEWNSVSTSSSAASRWAQWSWEALRTAARITAAITAQDIDHPAAEWNLMPLYDSGSDTVNADYIVVIKMALCGGDGWAARWCRLVWLRRQHLSTFWYHLGPHLWTPHRQV